MAYFLLSPSLHTPGYGILGHHSLLQWWQDYCFTGSPLVMLPVSCVFRMTPKWYKGAGCDRTKKTVWYLKSTMGLPGAGCCKGGFLYPTRSCSWFNFLILSRHILWGSVGWEMGYKFWLTSSPFWSTGEKWFILQLLSPWKVVLSKSDNSWGLLNSTLLRSDCYLNIY